MPESFKIVVLFSELRRIILRTEQEALHRALWLRTLS
jgi:hypothetical protein